MPNSNPQIERLKAMLGLEEKRTALQGQLDALVQQMSTLKERLFDDISGTPVKAGAKPGRGRKKRTRRGALKEQILTALSGAGQAGVRVTELASTLGTKAANIHAWFHSTAKRIPGIEKVAGGHYRLKGGTPPPAAKTATKPKAKGRKTKGKGAKRGQLSDNILRSLEAAGEKGLTIKELSSKTGAKYRNVSVWFVTTGKKFPKIKKLGPAHYKLAA